MQPEYHEHICGMDDGFLTPRQLKELDFARIPVGASLKIDEGLAQPVEMTG